MLDEEFCTYMLLASGNHVNSSCWSYMHVIVQVTKMPQGKRICLQSKEIVNQVFNYFSKMEKRCTGRGAPKKPLEVTGSWVLWRCSLVECYLCVGISKRPVKMIRRETSYGSSDFSPQGKWADGVFWLIPSIERPLQEGRTSCTKRRKTRLSWSCW